MANPRFNNDANTIHEAETYLLNRAEQLLIDGFKFTHFERGNLKIPGVVTAYFTEEKTNECFASHYILKDYRNRGLFTYVVKQINKPIITIPDCNIVDYLERNNIPHKVGGTFIEFREYRAIENFYSGKCAKRSGIQYMNHIDEGIKILKDIKATEAAQRAFCLHPIVQIDSDLVENYNQYLSITVDPWFMALAMEYRHYANAYLSPMGRKKAIDIKLSPIKDVNDMLIADKIQNRKDFEAHREKYTNKDDLDHYFKVWLERLGVSEETYQISVKKILI